MQVMRAVIRLVIATLLLIFVGIGVREGLGDDEPRDLGSFIASGRSAAANPYTLDDPLIFRPSPGTISVNLNPPISVLLFQAIADVHPEATARVWAIGSIALYTLALLWLVRLWPETSSPMRLLWAFALGGLWHLVTMRQIYVPLLLVAIGVAVCLRANRPAIAGLLIGVLVAIKPQFAIWPALLFATRHYRPSIVAGVVTCLLSLLPVFVYGPEVYLQWHAVLGDEPAKTINNHALPSTIMRLGFSRSAAIGMTALVLIAVAFHLWRKRPHVFHVSALSIVVALLAGPVTWAGYTILLLPVLWLLRWSPAIIGAAALLAVPVPMFELLAQSGPAALVAFGGLYTWALLAILITLIRRVPYGDSSHDRNQADSARREFSALRKMPT